MEFLPDRRWYLASKGEAHERLKVALEETMGAERERLTRLQQLLLIYRERRGNFTIPGSVVSAESVTRTARNKLRSLVKTAQSRLLALKAIPFYCSDGGDQDLRNRLELLNEAVAGLYVSTRFDEDYAPLMALHGALFGTGHVKVVSVGAKIKIERVYPWELYVDPLDGLYGEPRTLYHVRWLDRPVLYDLYKTPRAKEAIRKANVDRPEWAAWVRGLGEPVRVVEAWHLPDDEGKGGRHVIALENWTLLDEEYTHDDFPVVTYRWEDSEDGYWPDGLGHELIGKQIEINRMSDAISEVVRRCAWPRIFVEKNSEVSSAQLDNTIGAIVRYQGVRPDVQTAQGLTAEPINYVNGLAASCHEDTGISEMTATAQKPGGLTSGRALRIYADQQDGRLRAPGEKWTAARVAVGRALVRAMRDVAKEHPDAEFWFTDPKANKNTRIVWKDVDLPDERLALVCQPVSSLPQTPAAKAAMLDELYNAGSGIITTDEYRDALDLPDLKAMTEPAKAPRRAIEKSLDAIVKSGGAVYVPPEPFFPLEMALTLSAQRYCQAFVDDADEATLAALRQYVQDCKDMMAAAQPPPSPEAAPVDAAAMPTEPAPVDGAGPAVPPEMLP